MPRFFVNDEQINENTVVLTGDDAHHIARSLRMAVGETLTVCDRSGDEYTCKIEAFDEDREVRATVIRVDPSSTEPKCKITLFQALPKGDKLDTVIQKAVECGASRIVPFESERCIVKVKADAEERKTQRRARIAEEAAKQSGRSMLPTVSPTVSFDQMIREASEAGLALLCYEGERAMPIGRVLENFVRENNGKPLPDIAVIVGSEGGFSPEEVRRATEAGMTSVGLGNRILRTETAPIFALSCIIMSTELT